LVYQKLFRSIDISYSKRVTVFYRPSVRMAVTVFGVCTLQTLMLVLRPLTSSHGDDDACCIN